MPRKDGIPNKPRFAWTSGRAYKLLVELGINRFPVEPKDIIKHFSDWILLEYDELRTATGIDDPINLQHDKTEAKTIKLRDTVQYLIIYDACTKSDVRIRWTLAHEIGHIVLGHLDHFDVTKINRGGLTKEEYSVLEVEANWFAAELLSPKPVLASMDMPPTIHDISLMCGISVEAAERRFAQLGTPNTASCVDTGRLQRNFFRFFHNKEHLNIIHKSGARFYGKKYYYKICRSCRICKRCNSYIQDVRQTFCHICGVNAPDIHQYNPIDFELVFGMESDTHRSGQSHFSIPSSASLHVLICPNCGNDEIEPEDRKCGSCGTTLYNKCLRERRVVDIECRYCPDCGSETSYRQIYENKPNIIAPKTFSLPFEFDDYIEYEHWGYILSILSNKKSLLKTYAVLAGTVCYRDDLDFVIFTTSERYKNVIDGNKFAIAGLIDKHGYISGAEVRCLVV